eukprot:scaffold17741_cov67-Cyclotella_meneghiniana.AAC.2
MVVYLLPVAAFFGSFVITSALHRSLPWQNASGGLYVAGWLSMYAHPRGSADKIAAIRQFFSRPMMVLQLSVCF